MKVTGNIDSGFVAEFVPRDVGAHTLTVEYNGQSVGGTPFLSKAYDAKRVFVGPLPRGQVGKTLQFMGKFASFTNYHRVKFYQNFTPFKIYSGIQERFY